jgi:hypothetical protein
MTWSQDFLLERKTLFQESQNGFNLPLGLPEESQVEHGDQSVWMHWP